MIIRIYLPLLLIMSMQPAFSVDSLPDNIRKQLPDISILSKPGVYTLNSGDVIGVGQGKISSAMRESQAVRHAMDSAERDAKQKIAKHLFPEQFKKYSSVSITMSHSRRVFEDSDGQNAYVAILVNAGDVSVFPQVAAEVILDSRNISLDQAYLSFLEDPLLQIGGGRVYAYKDGWLAIGVGLAPLIGSGSVAERDALRLAKLEAGKVLAESIFGSYVESLENTAQEQIERDGLIRMREWTSRRTRESIEGELRKASEIGYWLTNDDHVAVAMAISSVPLSVTAISNGSTSNVIPEYPDWEVEPPWEYVLLDNPRLLKGGVILYPEGTDMYAVAVGTAKLSGNVNNDRINAPRVAEMDARRQIIKYLVGFSVKGKTEAREEIELVMSENGFESSKVIESLSKMGQEKASGMVRGMQKTGSWKSEDRSLLFQVHIVKVMDVFGK